MDRVRSFWLSQEPSITSMLLRSESEAIDLLERPEVMSYIPSFNDLSVLDLGAGIGRFTGEFAGRAKSVCAVDLVPQFIEKNRENNRQYSNVDYLCEDIKEVDFTDASYDLIFVSGVFMYLEEEEITNLARKIDRWLKKGGHFFFRDSCSPHRETCKERWEYLRPLFYYGRLFDPLFTLVDSGSIQAYINLFADPFRCYWLYRKDSVKSQNEPV